MPNLQMIGLGLLLSAGCSLAFWQQYPGALVRVAVGPKGVWGVNSHQEIYKKTLNSWEKVSGSLKDISVGKNSVWGVNRNEDIWARSGSGGFVHVSGKLSQVDIQRFQIKY